ncbi:SAPS-domain-containing protein [Metschnikowia bicuspidata]|uniref:SAPS-domain-containing protein n=1 Tax=Metschnikowia bicuspidata TaxID=27322 RepID=A0A4P9ZE63_9ASCO|nr:SAPS-domain-containing protein [Metschnikowia bicuspidata]
MSFWPFCSSYGANSLLQKFFDSIVDASLVTVDQLMDDTSLQLEFLEELKTLSSKHKQKNTFLFVQLLLNDALSKNLHSTPGSDALSVGSCSTDANGGGSTLLKSALEEKLLELLLQPHILSGFLDYIVFSVDYFHDIVADQNADEDDPDMNTSSTEASLNASKESEIDTGESKEERTRRFIRCSAEVLSADLWVISNRIIETPALMGKLWLVLFMPNLHESLPSVAYLIQILDHFMETNSIELLNFIRKQELLVDIFLGLVEIPIIMDFFLKIIQTDKADSPSGILEVLSRQQLIPKVIDILKPDMTIFENKEKNGTSGKILLFRQTAATEFVKALVTISSNATLAVDLETNIGPNQLMRELASPQIIQTMLDDIMFFRIPSPTDPSVFYSNKHGIANCVAILIELIRKNNSDYDLNCGTYSSQLQNNVDGTGEINVHVMFQWLKDFEQNPPGARDPIYLGDLLEIFSNNLDGMVELIEMEPDLHPPGEIGSTVLGISKFKIAELVAELLHCSNMILLNSRKIAYLVCVRDEVRALQTKAISAALNENIHGCFADAELKEQDISDVTSGIDDVFLLEMDHDKSKKIPSKRSLHILTGGANDELICREILDNLEFEESDDDEPAVSNDNPFVSEQRSEQFRADPCVGDYFKVKLVDSGILQLIVGKLVKHPWHNFFHNVVFDLIQQIFNGKLNSFNSFLIVELFCADKCNITNLIVSAFRSQVSPRPGYMGHLILVSEEVVKFTTLYKPGLISSVIVNAVGTDAWDWFVSEILLKTRELYNVILGTEFESSEFEDSERRGDNNYGFEASGVGYMDMDSYQTKDNKSIVLADSSNHAEFLLQKVPEQKEEFELEYDDPKSFLKIPSLSVESMSPKLEFNNDDILYEDFEKSNTSECQDREVIETILGSSSSDDDDDSNQLRRMSKNRH